MISIAELREDLGNEFTDEELQEIRDRLYKLADILLEEILHDKIHHSDEGDHLLPSKHSRAS